MSALNQALELAARGIPVFPCLEIDRPDLKKERKAPYTRRGFKDATTNPLQIDAWWRNFPGALVGVPTGLASGLLILDADPNGAEWYAEHLPKLRAGRIHVTQRGHHVVYACPDPAPRSSTSKIAPGIDVRGEGGYAIWWPAEGLAAVGELDEIGPPPAWLLEEFEFESCSPPADYIAICSGITPEGDRNKRLTQLVGHLLRRDVNAKVVHELALAWGAARCTPPMDPAEITRTVRSIATRELRRRASA